MWHWQIYYGDSAIINSKDCVVSDVPTLNVQVILQYDSKVGWYLQTRGDYYIYRQDDRLWQAVDFAGLLVYLIKSGWKRVLLGETIRSEDYATIFQQAIEDRNELRSGRGKPCPESKSL